MKMKKLFVLSFIILGFIFTNCAFYDKVNKAPDYSVVGDYPITYLLKNDSTNINFNDNCGRVILVYNSVYGKTIDSNYLLLHIEQIKEFRISEQTPHPIEELAKFKIYELVLNNGRLVTFNENLGSYNSTNKMITGISNKDSDVSVHVNQIAFFYSEQPEILPYEKISSDTKLSSVVLKENNLIYVFDNNKGSILNNEPLVWGYDLNNKVVIEELKDLQNLKIKKFNYFMSTLGNGVLGLAIIIVPLFLLLWALGPISVG